RGHKGAAVAGGLGWGAAENRSHPAPTHSGAAHAIPGGSRFCSAARNVFWSRRPGSDESNSMARYAGALALFEQIEGKAGRAALQGWFKAVRRLDGPTDSARIAQLANEFTDEDISRALE